MNQVSGNSSPALILPTATTYQEQRHDDLALEGVATNIKLLLKLVQDHKHACNKETKNDSSSRRTLRVAMMLTILDNVRSRIQGCQSFGNRSKSNDSVDLSQSNQDLILPRDDQNRDDENDRLRRELSASIAAQKKLQVMCSSMGKEKEIIAAELSKKVQELSGMEELVSDIKAQNESLLRKVQDYAAGEKKRSSGGGDEALKERNKVLSEQLLRSLEGYRSMKRKLKGAQEENMVLRTGVAEMLGKAVASLERVGRLKECCDVGKEEIEALESMVEWLRKMDMKYDDHKKKGERIDELKGKAYSVVA